VTGAGDKLVALEELVPSEFVEPSENVSPELVPLELVPLDCVVVFGFACAVF
jgi:hypothetical protein